jgi:hypothetical protein
MIVTSGMVIPNLARRYTPRGPLAVLVKDILRETLALLAVRIVRSKNFAGSKHMGRVTTVKARRAIVGIAIGVSIRW